MKKISVKYWVVYLVLFICMANAKAAEPTDFNYVVANEGSATIRNVQVTSYAIYDAAPRASSVTYLVNYDTSIAKVGDLFSHKGSETYKAKTSDNMEVFINDGTTGYRDISNNWTVTFEANVDGKEQWQQFVAVLWNANIDNRGCMVKIGDLGKIGDEYQVYVKIETPSGFLKGTYARAVSTQIVNQQPCSLFNYVVANEGSDIVKDVKVRVHTWYKFGYPDSNGSALNMFNTSVGSVGDLMDKSASKVTYQAEMAGNFYSIGLNDFAADYNYTYVSDYPIYHNTWEVTFSKNIDGVWKQFKAIILADITTKDGGSPSIVKIGDLGINGNQPRVYVKIEAPISGVIKGEYAYVLSTLR